MKRKEHRILKQIRKTMIFSVLLFSFAVMAGCAGKEEREAAAAVSGTEVTFTDDLGTSVTVDRPKQAAALLGSFAKVWTLAGGDLCASADDAWEDLGMELPETVVNLGNTKELSMELLLASQPEFILASTNTRQNMEWKDILKESHIPTAYFDIVNFEDYLRLLKICTEITGCSERYEKYGLKVQAQIEEVRRKNNERREKAAAEDPSVLTLIASSAGVRAKNSDATVLGAILKDLGCVNIADSDAGFLENVSMEYILQQDPDYLFLVQRGDDEEGMRQYVTQFMMEHPAWSKLTAVKNGRVYFMEKTLYNLKPNERWGEAYEKVEEILHE